MNGINDTIVATSEMGQCRWEMQIEGCEDISFFRTITEIALSLHIITFILSTSLLFYRRVKCHSKLWNGQCFTALDGFLFWADIWCIGRIIFTIDELISFTKDFIILRYILFEINAFPPIIAVAAYASGLFYAIPRMNFYQPSSTQRQYISTSLKSKLNNIIKKSQPSQIYLPPSQTVSYFYWFFVAFFFIMTFIPLIISGIAEQNNNNTLRDIFWSFHYLMYAIAYGLLTLVLVYYGFILILSYSQMLVRLSEESASLSNDELEKQKYKKFVNKMKIFNLTLTFAFLWIILGLTIFAFWRKIYSYNIANKIFAFMFEVFSVVAALIIVCALFYSEIVSSRIIVEAPSHSNSYTEDNIIVNETRDSNVIGTRTSWYIGSTRVQPPLPTTS